MTERYEYVIPMFCVPQPELDIDEVVIDLKKTSIEISKEIERILKQESK